MKKAELARRAIKLAWGETELTGYTKWIVDGPDHRVLRYFRRCERALAAPMQTVMDEAFHLRDGGKTTKRFEELYMHLEEVLDGRS